MQVAILDPGLRKIGGHHLDLDLRLAAKFRQDGHAVTVAGHKRMPEPVRQTLLAEDVAADALFRLRVYWKPTEGQDPCKAILAGAEAFQQDLSRVPGADLWLLPTLTPPQLLGYANASGVPPMIGIIHFGPSTTNACGGEMWAMACRLAMERRMPVALGAYDDDICCNYRSLSGGLTIHRFPTPHDGVGPVVLPESPRRIGFFGNQRAEKGGRVIPDLAAALIGRGLEVLIQDSDGTLPPLPSHPRLSVLPHVHDFAATMATCDLVVWPSQAPRYLGHTSGVVCEAVASGLPLVAPSDCLPANRIAEIGSGTFFHQFSLTSIMRAVDEAIARYPELARAALRGAQAWKSREGTARFVTLATNGTLWS